MINVNRLSREMVEHRCCDPANLVSVVLVLAIKHSTSRFLIKKITHRYISSLNTRVLLCVSEGLLFTSKHI